MIQQWIDVDLKQIYACHLNLEDYLTNVNGDSFERSVYRSHPDRFYSQFDTKVRHVINPRAQYVLKFH